MKPHENFSLESIYGEVWGTIEEYKTKYLFSSMGRVKILKHRHRPELIKKPSVSHDGYVYVLLSINNKRNMHRAHRLVAQAFIPNIYNKPLINHKNGIKWDNRVGNLEWVTYSENSIHAVETGLMPISYGEETSQAKLSNTQVLEIYSSTLNEVELAKMYKVQRGTIAAIKDGRNWGFLTGKKYEKKGGATLKQLDIDGELKTYKDIFNEYGISPSLLCSRIKKYGGKAIFDILKPVYKLKKEDILVIYQSKESSSTLSKNFGVSQCMINMIRRGESWHSVTRP